MPKARATARIMDEAELADENDHRSSLPTEFIPHPDLDEQRWQNRIVGYDPAVDPSQLLANPQNWRIHPLAQQETLEGIFSEIGFVAPIIVNKRTGFVVDGHLRASLALRKGQTVPVNYVDLDDNEERIVLATFDVTTGMAASDLSKMSDLVGDIREVQNEKVTGILTTMKAQADQTLARMEARNQAQAESTSNDASAVTGSAILGLREDAVFPGHGVELIMQSDFGIPALLPAMIGREEDIPSETWDGVEKITPPAERFLFVYGACAHPPEGRGGTLCFYVDDQRFEVVWNDAVRIITKLRAFGYSAVVAPNFSLWSNDPVAYQIYNIYRAAWVARYWQEAGIRIIPDLNFSTPDTYDVAMKHIPIGCDVVATQVRTSNAQADVKARARMISGLEYQLDYLKPKNVIIYGGVDHVWLQTALPKGPTYHYLDSFMGVRGRRGLLGKSKQKKERLKV